MNEQTAARTREHSVQIASASPKVGVPLTQAYPVLDFLRAEGF